MCVSIFRPHCPELRKFVQNSDKESRELIGQLEHTCAELKRTVTTLKEKNVKLKAELSTAEQEIKIHNAVEREHRVSLHLVHDARRLITIPE